MPVAKWNLSAGTVKDFDRESQFKPYQGPIPPNYSTFVFKLNSLKFIPADNDKNPQLRIGLTLVPRDKEEKKYSGYRLLDFAPVADNTAFRYVPFLDVLGVTEADFRSKTNYSTDGDIKSIGRWRNNGDQLILATLKHEEDNKGRFRMGIAAYGPVPDSDETDDEDTEEEYEDYDDEDDIDGEYDDADDDDEEVEEEYEEDDEYDEDEDF